jgi:PKD repeat protein
MKKVLLFATLFAMLLVGACKKSDNPADEKPGPVKITADVPDNSNIVSFHAEAENAVKYVWDLGNGETPTGQDVKGTYKIAGKYTVKCTAVGRYSNSEDSISIQVKVGDPDVYNEVNMTLSGYNPATGKSEAVWTWVDAPGVFCDGPRDGVPDTVYFNPIDYSYWQNEAGDIDSAALDDQYSFKLNAKMEYVNDFGKAFMVNWAWAAVRGYVSPPPPIWEDVAYTNYQAPASSWSVEHIDNINDTLTFETNINGQMKSGAYVIHLTNGASLGMESAGHDYQILKLTHDTLWVRYDNSFPKNLGDFYNIDDLNSEGAIPGDPDESYLKLVRKK